MHAGLLRHCFASLRDYWIAVVVDSTERAKLQEEAGQLHATLRLHTEDSDDDPRRSHVPLSRLRKSRRNAYIKEKPQCHPMDIVTNAGCCVC